MSEVLGTFLEDAGIVRIYERTRKRSSAPGNNSAVISVEVVAEIANNDGHNATDDRTGIDNEWLVAIVSFVLLTV